GQAYEMKRRLQSAADAGAIAAAQELRLGDTTKFQQVVLNNIQRNGFTSSDTTISILNPPKTGKRAGDANFVEVALPRQAPLYFMKPFYNSNLMVEARAIGGVRATDTCILSLNKSASPGLLVSGNAYIDLSPCGAQVNSTSSGAARSNGGSTFKAA